MRNFFTGRSPVYAEGGVAATAHPQASLIALDVLRSGGNAVDAAIAAIAALCVIEPASTGIGGDCFVLYSPKAGLPIGLNGSGRAPAKATLEWYQKQGIKQIAVQTPHAVTVPGAIDAWARLHADHGTKPWAELLQPAIKAAAEGFIVTPKVGYDWIKLTPKLAADKHAAKRMLNGGVAPKIGSKHRQPELAETLKLVAKHGRDGFYRGVVAKDIVDRLNELGGLHSLDDLALNHPDYVEPIHTNYRGYDVYEIPPNGQGITALIMLNALQGYEYGSARYSEADRIHLLSEVAKAAYLRRDTLIGDPDFVEVPVERLLSSQEAGSIRKGIRLDRAGDPAALEAVEHADTTYLCVVDKDRNAVSFINSLFAGFGSGILAPKSGVMLQNRGCGFRLEEGHPAAIAPRKRPFHTIIPGMLVKDGRAVMPFGVMGGHYQPTGHTTLLTNMIDHDMDPQSALAAPRSFAYEGELRLEQPISEPVAQDLAKRGHDVRRLEDPVGGGQAIWIDHQAGTLCAGSEPRKDGCAMGY
ncbi:MAG: gamma-glutamyltransferase [Proteobacteria bacterium]|nr:gamma-glutamyltransferase [Pseudomonadota bacterium]MBI3498120.1 gamma-glutamyltransferase [Pseudomonadota bacterium]